MSMLQARPDGVGPTEGVVREIRDQRKQPDHRRRFPKVPGEDEKEKEKEAPASDIRPASPQSRDDAEDGKIDIHVIAPLLPTGKFLPTHGPEHLSQ